MKLLNSSTNNYVKLNKENISMYCCGPTVYNHVHIGNVRPLIIFDVLNRFLISQNKNVLYVQNITDVDDKIINSAEREGISEKELSSRYTKAYLDLFEILNILPMSMPKVSENIEDIKQYILKLISKNFAYEVNGNVYFDVSKIKNYGHISHQNVTNLLDGVRKENKNDKKNPLDFVLWKKTTKGINWDSEWSKGRPGWHTECCVLINKYIGDHTAIHGGGVDLKFPHHENENAQNVALFNRDIADIWVHVGHVNINGAKMSKSLNNFVFVKDIVNESNANGLRWFFYKTKYEQPINFSKILLDEAIKDVNNIIKNIMIAKTYIIANNAQECKSDEMNLEFVNQLSDDLNLPNAISILQKQISQLNFLVRSKKFNESNKLLQSIVNELKVLGIKLNLNIHDENMNIIKQWKASLDQGNFNEADKYRKILQEKGIL